MYLTDPMEFLSMVSVTRNHQRNIEKGVKSLYKPFKITPKVTFMDSPKKAVKHVKRLLKEDEERRTKWCDNYDLPTHVKRYIDQSVLSMMGRTTENVMTTYPRSHSFERPHRVSRTGVSLIKREILHNAKGGELEGNSRSSELTFKHYEPDIYYDSVKWFFGLIFLTDKEVVAVNPPKTDEYRHSNSNCDDAPIVGYDDGTELYMLRGNFVPGKLVMNPEGITREEFMNENNVEVRRLMYERMGQDRFIEIMDLRVLDVGDVNGKRVELLQTAEIDKIIGERIKYVRVTCNSTGRVYHLCVPPNITGAVEGVAWTFDMTPEEYKLYDET